MPVMAQTTQSAPVLNVPTTYTFTAGTVNVDGLTIGNTADADDAAGREITSRYLCETGWDILAIAEDFNYHDELISHAQEFYNFGAHGGTADLSLTNLVKVLGNVIGGNGASTPNSIKTDGLGIGVGKWLTFDGAETKGTQVAWNNCYGAVLRSIIPIEYDENGADNFITKGFRMYTVWFDEAKTIGVDVYLVHMDAGTADSDNDYDTEGKDKNIVAREAQLTQLANYIKANHNNRPVLIMGDTNCRYTREQLKTKFIDAINADSRLTIKDAWIELIYEGVYPTYGTESLMTHTLGAQKGEVVDKIFYINSTESNVTLKANTYWNDAAQLSISDHTPVMVNFSITNKDSKPQDPDCYYINGEGVDASSQWVDGEPSTEITKITDNTEYYMRNVESGLFFKAGNYMGTQFSEGYDGLPVKMTKVSNNTYQLVAPTMTAYIGNDYFVDNPNEGEDRWEVIQIESTRESDGNKETKYKFVFVNPTDEKAIASQGDGTHIMAAAYDPLSQSQQWQLYTKSEMIDAIKAEMAATVKGATYNATALINMPMANAYGDTRHNSAWTKTASNGSIVVGGAWPDEVGANVWEKFEVSEKNKGFEMSQTLSGLPEGTYTVKVQALYRIGGSGTTNSTVHPYLFAGSSTHKITSILNQPYSNAPLWWNPGHNEFLMNSAVASNPSGYIPNTMYGANKWFRDGHYWTAINNVTVGSNGTLRIGIKNAGGTGWKVLGTWFGAEDYPKETWCCFDNFQLIWHGTASGQLKDTEVYRNIKSAVDEAFASLPDAAKQYFDISDVNWRYTNEKVSEDGKVELRLIEEAVEAALKAMPLETDTDLSSLIKNYSFELGTLKGWTVNYAEDTGVKSNSGNYKTEGGHEKYIFNTSANTEVCTPLKQTVSAIRNGYYWLTASVTSEPGKTVYLVANDQYAGTDKTLEAEKFVELTVKCLVENGKLDILTVGSDNGKFHYSRGASFKADYYRLIYKGSVAQGRMEIALDDADKKVAALTHQPAKDFYNNAVKQYRNATVSSVDGKAEEKAIYQALAQAITYEPRRTTDMTWLIENPSFEKGTYSGWTTTSYWDTNVYHLSESRTTALHADGLYLFNTWNDDVNSKNQYVNMPIYQVVDLPNGNYTLTAKGTSNAGNKIFLAAKGGDYSSSSADYKTAGKTIEEPAKEMQQLPPVTFDVFDGKATIMIVGADHDNNSNFTLEENAKRKWFKADDFRLTYNHHTLNVASDEAANDKYKEFKPSDVYEGEDWYTDVTVNRQLKDQLSENEIPEGGKAAMWHSVVLPFDVDAETLATWGKKVEVKELTGYKVSGDLISLIFSDAEGITAGMPCMLRLTDNDNLIGSSPYKEIDVDYVTVKSEQSTPDPTPTNDDATTYKVKFLGVYETSYLPQGAFYISNNKFYKVTNGGNKTKIKPFRAYFVVEDEQGNPAPFARGMRLVTDEDVTGIETADNTEPTVVGIYNLNGMRIDEIQDGVNIIRMSDGTSVKIIMK